MADNEQQSLEAVLLRLYGAKELNKKLLRENTDLKLENAKLKRKVEWYEAFQKRRTKK